MIPKFNDTYKKRDCTIAVPLTEALVLPFVPNNNTEAHAVCTYIRDNTRTLIIYTPWASLCCNVLEL